MRKISVFLAILVMIASALSACGNREAQQQETSPATVATEKGIELTVIGLVPAVDSVQEIEAESLRAAASILETRLESVGVSDYHVAVDESSKQITVSYPQDQEDYVSEDLLKRAGRFRICDSDGNEALDGGDVVSAAASILMNPDEEPEDTALDDDQYIILIEFTDDGAEKFKKLTEENLNRKTSIYLDDELICEPVVQAVITDGNVQITTDRGAEDTSRIASIICAGELPYPLTIVSSTAGSVKTV